MEVIYSLSIVLSWIYIPKGAVFEEEFITIAASFSDIQRKLRNSGYS